MNATLDKTEFLAAMKSLKRAKNFFSLLIVLALLVQGACFITIYFFDTEITATAITQCKAAAQCGEAVPCWYNLLIWAFPVSKLVALLSGGMLVLVLMYTGVFALSGGGGVAYLISATLWGIFLFALLCPWQEILRGELFSGAIYSLNDLCDWLIKVQYMTAADKTIKVLDKTRFFSRFLGYPIIALLVLLMMLAKYAKGYKALTKPMKATGSSEPQPKI